MAASKNEEEKNNQKNPTATKTKNNKKVSEK